MKKIKHVKVNLSVLLLLLATTLFITNSHLLNSNEEFESLLDLEENERDKDPKVSADWVSIPTTDKKYFSPNTSIGVDDTILYYFSVNDDGYDYELNVSAYYDPIDNYPGFYSTAEGAKSNAYLMSNGTWLALAVDSPNKVLNEGTLVVGIGTDSSNMEWKSVGPINDDLCLVNQSSSYGQTFTVAADEDSGKIVIAYFERVANSYLGLKSYVSTDWGESWVPKDIIQYAPVSSIKSGSTQFYGISMDVQNDNFTCAWGVSTNAQSGGLLYRNVSFSQLNSKHPDWSPIKNFSYPSWGNPEGINSPQVFYNHTDEAQTHYNDDATLFVAYDTNQFTYISKFRYEDNLTNFPFEYKKAIPNNPSTGSGNPMVHACKDFSKDQFFFLDRTELEMNHRLRNSSWGPDPFDGDYYDYFKTEAFNNGNFRLFGNHSPICYSGFTKSALESRIPGILDCKGPFDIRDFSGTTEAYKTMYHIFDGRDDDGVYNGAKAYAFQLTFDGWSTGKNTQYVYVDTIPATLNLDTSGNKISPFSSLGKNDTFTLTMTSDKPGDATFKVYSDLPSYGEYNITEGVFIAESPSITGEGLNKYMVYYKSNDPFQMIMFTKSKDGGFTWDEPKMIRQRDGTYNSQYWKTLIIKVSDSTIYVWALDSGHNQFLYTSSDDGNSFIEYDLPQEVHGVTSDLICWRFEGDTNLKVHASNDYGISWQLYQEFPESNTIDYLFEDVAHDPISGNYSFLFIHDSDKKAYIYNGNESEYVKSMNLLPNGNQFGTSYQSMFDLEVRTIDESTSQWVLFTTANNTIDEDDQKSILAYSFSTNGFNFSSWNNISDVIGRDIEAFCSQKNRNSWDVYFSAEGQPCFVTGIKGPTKTPTQLETTCYSTTIYSTIKELKAGKEAQIIYNGLTTDGEVLDDGSYDWVLSFIDQGGYEDLNSGTLLIDNTLPLLIEMANYTTPERPFPSDEVHITVPVNETNPKAASLYYKNSTGEWHFIQMDIDRSKLPEINLTATIPAQDNANTIYWKVEIADECGNNLTIDNNGLYYSYSRGIFEYLVETTTLNPTLYDDWNWTMAFTSGADHLVNVTMSEYFDDIFQQNLTIDATSNANTTFLAEFDKNFAISKAKYTFYYESDDGVIHQVDSRELTKPVIKYIKQASILSPTLYDNWTWTYTFSDGVEYVEEVWLNVYHDDLFQRKIVMNASGDENNAYAIDMKHVFGISKAKYQMYYKNIEGNSVEMETLQLSKPLIDYTKQKTENTPTLYDDWTWTYSLTSGADYIVQVKMLVYLDSKLDRVVVIAPSGDANATYTINIAHVLSAANATYVFQYVTDEGNVVEIETIRLSRPTILLLEDQEPPAFIDLGEISNFTINFNVPDHNKYVDYVYIEYNFDDGLGLRKANLTHNSPVYKYVFTNFTDQVTLLNYTVKGVDIYGNEFSFNKTRLVTLIPALPSWEMTTELQTSTIIISLIVGAMCGLSYSVINRKKKTKDRMPEELGLYQSRVPGTIKDLVSEDVKKIQKKELADQVKKETLLLGGDIKKMLSVFLALLGLTACVIGAFIVLFVFNIPEITMLFFAGAMLTAIMLWVLLSAHSVEKVFRTQKQTTMLNDQLLLTILAVVIYIMILGIFFTGNLIPWWRVRLNQTSYNFGPLTVPRALTTLSTTFFSSIFLLTWSTFKELSKKADELKDAESLNENPLRIIERREEAISSTISNVGKKGILFVVIIAVTIIFASDLSVYAPQGVSILLPFVIGAIGVLLVISFLKREDKVLDKKVVLDNIINCSHCGKETPLGGNFCEHCGEKLLAGKRFSDGIECPSCAWINTSGSSHCRYCGAKIEGLRSKSASKGKKQKSRKTESKKLKHDPNL